VTIEAAVAAAAEEGARRALEGHLPRLTLSRAEAAMLGVSTSTVDRFTATGKLAQVAAGRITLASVLALAGWPMQAAPLAAPASVIPTAELQAHAS